MVVAVRIQEPETVLRPSIASIGIMTWQKEKAITLALTQTGRLVDRFVDRGWGSLRLTLLGHGWR
jgi:hypothetical protein